MTQGIFINGARPKSMKAIKEAIEAGARVRVEATSLCGPEFDGAVTELPIGKKVYFVGPCPFTSRKFYGHIERTGEGIKFNDKLVKVTPTTK
jgi:hypothetical protein